MKTKLTLLLLCFCSTLLSETYILTQELERFGRPGKTETIVLKRHLGEYFKIIKNDRSYNELLDNHKIHSESSDSLIIISTEKYSKDADVLNIFVINKKDMTWGQHCIILDDLKESMDCPGSFGKFTVIKD